LWVSNINGVVVQESSATRRRKKSKVARISLIDKFGKNREIFGSLNP
jgi:hypothetical protein